MNGVWHEGQRGSQRHQFCIHTMKMSYLDISTFFLYYLNIHTREQEEWQVLGFLNTVCISFKHLCSFCICSIFKLINDDKCEYVLCLSFPECWNDE